MCAGLARKTQSSSKRRSKPLAASIKKTTRLPFAAGHVGSSLGVAACTNASVTLGTASSRSFADVESVDQAAERHTGSAIVGSAVWITSTYRVDDLLLFRSPREDFVPRSGATFYSQATRSGAGLPAGRRDRSRSPGRPLLSSIEEDRHETPHSR